MMKIQRSLYLLSVSLSSILAAPSPTVVLDAGAVVGSATHLPSSDTVVNKYLGIPYAETPVGSLRFLPPVPLEEFPNNPLNATAYGHQCIQQNPGADFADPANESEDCLTLNVFAPARSACRGRGQPVLVWIHGGNLQSGYSGSSILDGTSLVSNHGIVVVTANYRVNAFGFPNSPEIPLTATNVGFLDQRLVLRWVHDNIAQFGGDPDRVTIAGESTGASSVDRLVNAPPRDFVAFHAAGEESGQATVGAWPRTAGPASWKTLAAALGCSDAESELACVQAADAQTIRTIVNDQALDFTPVNDNITQVATPFVESRAAGLAAPVALLIGNTANEGGNLASTYNLDINNVSHEQLLEIFKVFTGGNEELNAQLETLIGFIQAADDLSLFWALAKGYTELVYQCPAKLVADASVKNNLPTWRYYYNATFPNIKLDGRSDVGAFHVSDNSLIWGTYPTENATETEIELSKSVQAAWAGFVKDPYGAGPGWDRVDSAGGGLACLGCNGGTGVTSLDAASLDARCPLYQALYDLVNTPAF